jgi:hypothetical protein
MSIEEIVKVLENRGYEVEQCEVVKNGVNKKGIAIANALGAPVIYVDEMIRTRKPSSAEEAADIIEKISKENKFNFDVRKLTPSFVKDYIRFAIQKAGSENIVKRPCLFPGLEEYLLLIWDNDTADQKLTCKISSDHLKLWGISEEEAWELAEANTNSDVHIVSLANMVQELCGFGFAATSEDDGLTWEPMVITNHFNYKGASAILCKSAKDILRKKWGARKILVLPSSIHECIIIPYTDTNDFTTFGNVVMEVNATEVSEDDRLSDEPFIMDLA